MCKDDDHWLFDGYDPLLYHVFEFIPGNTETIRWQSTRLGINKWSSSVDVVSDCVSLDGVADRVW